MSRDLDGLDITDICSSPYILETWCNGVPTHGIVVDSYTADLDLYLVRPLTETKEKVDAQEWLPGERSDVVVSSGAKFTKDSSGIISFEIPKQGLAKLYPAHINPKKSLHPDAQAKKD
jgi:hypothetical protein